MRASLKAKYDTEKNTAASAASLTVNAGNVKLRASMTDATLVNGPSLNGLALTFEKPGFFIFDYNVPKKDFRFQFMNSIRVLDKPLNLTYIHSKGDNRTILDGTLVLDSANKVAANHMLGSGNVKLKYSYIHGGLTTFDQSYDVAKNSWDFAVSRKVYAYGDNLLKASYQTSSKALSLDWARSSKINGSYKVSASLSLADELKVPRLMAESTWDFEMFPLLHFSTGRGTLADWNPEPEFVAKDHTSSFRSRASSHSVPTSRKHGQFSKKRKKKKKAFSISHKWMFRLMPRLIPDT